MRPRRQEKTQRFGADLYAGARRGGRLKPCPYGLVRFWIYLRYFAAFGFEVDVARCRALAGDLVLPLTMFTGFASRIRIFHVVGPRFAQRAVRLCVHADDDLASLAVARWCS